MRIFSLLILLLASSATFAIGNHSTKLKLKVGDMAPETLGNTLDGTEIRAEQYRGKVLVVNFWATWCAPCKHEISALAQIREQVDAAHLAIVAINLGESRKIFVDATEPLAQTGLTFTLDPNRRISRELGVNTIPLLLLIDPEGKIESVKIDFNKKTLHAFVDKLNIMLSRKQAKPAPTSL